MLVLVTYCLILPDNRRDVVLCFIGIVDGCVVLLGVVLTNKHIKSAGHTNICCVRRLNLPHASSLDRAI